MDNTVRCPICLERGIHPFSEDETEVCDNCGQKVQYCSECHGDGIENRDDQPQYWRECKVCQGTGLEPYAGHELRKTAKITCPVCKSTEKEFLAIYLIDNLVERNVRLSVHFECKNCKHRYAEMTEPAQSGR